MMQANIFWFRDPKNIGLHHRCLRFQRLSPQTQLPTALTRDILEIQEIYDAGQHFLVSGSQNIGLHRRFLKFLRFRDTPQVPTALAREILEI